jgi:DNA-binding NarL/FixJ family response regulator
MSIEPVRVFIVDDHELLRSGLRGALEATDDIDVVGEADRFEGTADAIADVGPDVAIIDVRLGDGNGVELCRQLQTRGVPTRCLIFTSATGDEGLYESIRAGASGYLLKRASATEIVSAVRTVAAGHALVDPVVTGSLLAKVRRDATQAAATLTAQERQVLHLIGEGLGNAEIAERLALAPQTVKNYVSRVLTKLHMTRTRAALYAAASHRAEEEGRAPGRG